MKNGNSIDLRKRLKAMQKMRATGIPDAEIGRRVGLSRQRVYTILGAKDPGGPKARFR